MSNILSTRRKGLKLLCLGQYLCNYSDVYVFVKGAITIEGTNGNNQINKELGFNKNSLCRLYI